MQMQVPVGFLAKLWSFVSFLPFFLLLLLGSIKGNTSHTAYLFICLMSYGLLGVLFNAYSSCASGYSRMNVHGSMMMVCDSEIYVKCTAFLRRFAVFVAVLIGPVVAAIVFFGNSAVIVGLWPAHFIWTYYCVLKTKRTGPVLKILTMIFLPLPLLLLPVLGILGSLLVGIGYGVFATLMATFEAVGEGVTDKLNHCFLDGTASTIRGACMVVRDVTDFCFHSYFSFMDELVEKMGDDETPLDIKLSYLPWSFLVALVAVPVDVLMITGVALWKSPCKLLKGWQRL